ncbi:hypothetical protein H6G76_30120 [Nostoc sp. FACHB-152]|uniref:hypothetical protein n=1 Tax=unclassified Nostoc TaxID=2593658 RepID=UPI001686D0CD|nr:MULTISPECIES: hypothetical protein [unclassified Nostoc]MBD2451309.1 hypothetical protein [Nostoc sp. FACHB-152]MBD2471265.1 hypothetical protein [Nostoc sp. FACHB-145]
MATIKINDLCLENENYMNDISDGELDIQGGILPLLLGIAVGALASEVLHHHL